MSFFFNPHTSPMTQEECFQLGKITKPFGFKGQVVFFLDVDCPDDYSNLDSVFVEVKGNLIPYFIFKKLDYWYAVKGLVFSLVIYTLIFVVLTFMK